MQQKILYKPSYALLRIGLLSRESIKAEAGAMVSMDTNIEVETSLGVNAGNKKGLFAKLFSSIFAFIVALVRKFAGGESIFINTFTAKGSSGEILLAPTLTGDIERYTLEDSSITLQAGAYLASTEEISLKTKFGGLKALFSGEGIFFLECSGTGDLFFNSYGGIHVIEVDGTYDIDTGHLVGFEPTLDWSIKSVGGLKSMVLSGEGLIIKFRGKGKVWVQTRQMNSFVGWVSPLLPRN